MRYTTHLTPITPKCGFNFWWRDLAQSDSSSKGVQQFVLDGEGSPVNVVCMADDFTDAPSLKRQGLFPCEAKIARRLSQSERRWREIARQLEREGLPKIDPMNARAVLACGRRILPLATFDQAL
jgi:hypothetical protein